MTYNVSESNTHSLDQVCTLHNAFTGETDDLGNPIKDASGGVEVFCAEQAVYGKEFHRAGQRGIKAELELLVDRESYSGEDRVTYNGIMYTVYHSIPRKDGLVELYLAQRSGH